jgi:large subunit ribosomal protein L25
MNTLTIKASLREETGATDAKKLRNSGWIPAVVYGATQPIHVAIAELELKPLLYTADVFIVNLEVNGETHTCFLKDLQFHPVTDKAMHVDFFMPAPGSEITISIPVRLTGTSPGVLAGGKLTLNKRKLKVKAFIDSLPDAVTLDISKLRLGQGIRVKEVALPNATILEASSIFVVQVKTARGAVEVATQEEAEATPAAETPAAE